MNQGSGFRRWSIGLAFQILLLAAWQLAAQARVISPSDFKFDRLEANEGRG